MNLNPNNFFNEFNKRLSTYSDYEIITVFNKEVGNSGWGTARAVFLSAIHNEFDQRKFDYSEIGDSKTLSFKNPICLVGKKVSISFYK